MASRQWASRPIASRPRCRAIGRFRPSARTAVARWNLFPRSLTGERETAKGVCVKHSVQLTVAHGAAYDEPLFSLFIFFAFNLRNNSRSRTRRRIANARSDVVGGSESDRPRDNSRARCSPGNSLARSRQRRVRRSVFLRRHSSRRGRLVAAHLTFPPRSRRSSTAYWSLPPDEGRRIVSRCPAREANFHDRVCKPTINPESLGSVRSQTRSGDDRPRR